ncbi:MAG: hypothetical protein H6722_16185 [Sandaracinus sp.]|nr:hypothetical protein [Sandaracinus sp.]MCB9613980.1 hypothetical protein [Sandaracinus sp.]
MRCGWIGWLVLLGTGGALACGGGGSGDPDTGPVETPDAGFDTGSPQDAGVDAGPSFQPGPYGDNYHDRVGPFVAPTLGGSLDFETAFTGEDHFLFSLFLQGNAYSEQLWTGSILEYPLEDAPPNTHFVFLAALDPDGTDRATEHVTAMRDRFETLFTERPDLAPWRERLHFVTTAAQNLDGALGAHFRMRPALAFGIDRDQRWRPTGLLASPTGGLSTAQLAYLATEAVLWEFEHGRDTELARLDALHGVNEVVLFDGDRAGGGWGDDTGVEVTLDLPDAATMATYDTLEIEHATYCEDHDPSKCWEWDRISNLRLCDEDSCDVELARWITTYGRDGRWVTDASHALAFLQEGGSRRFRWDGSVTRTMDESVDRRYVVHVTLRLSNRGKADRAFAATPVFTGGRFDETYNDRQTPVSFTPPEGATRVELVTLITGHGFGAESSNCAEFCNHTHHFSLNGTEAAVQTNERANDNRGCARLVSSGVIPNQYGTWPFGRAGWCPGHDVPAWSTSLDARLGESNELVYQGGLAGTIPYVPDVTMPDGYRAEISLSAWLVYYR